jgi:hypothetical protein
MTVVNRQQLSANHDSSLIPRIRRRQRAAHSNFLSTDGIPCGHLWQSRVASFVLDEPHLLTSDGPIPHSPFRHVNVDRQPVAPVVRLNLSSGAAPA